jgi:hypothetical protein
MGLIGDQISQKEKSVNLKTELSKTNYKEKEKPEQKK